MKNKIFILITVLIIAASCVNNDVYFQYYNIPSEEGWDKEKEYNFDILIEDTIASYNVFVNVRNTSKYPYQNLWIFSSETFDQTNRNDTINFYLADNRGKWLGKGAGDIREMSVFLRQDIRFDKKGLYQIKLKQGMRDNLLLGLNDIGVRVEKISEK